MLKFIIVGLALLISIGCASQEDLWQAQENIVANDNRLAQSLADQHEEILAGSADDLRTKVEQLQAESARIEARAREIAQEAVSAKTIAADAIRGVETWLGGLSGPIGGVLGETIRSIETGVREQDDRLISVETKLTTNTQKVESIEESLDERIHRELRNLGLSEHEAGVLQENLSPTELLILLAVVGAGTGGGAFASKVGRSRSAPDISELKARIASIESKSNA